MKRKPTYKELEQRNRALEAERSSWKQVESTLQEIKEKAHYHRLLFEKATIGLALCRKCGEFVDVNPAYAWIIGRSVEETLQLTNRDIIPSEYAEDEQRHIETLEKTGRYGPYETEYIHKDGYRVPVRLSGMILDNNGEPHILSSVEDITEQVKAKKKQEYFEGQLRQIQKMEAVGTLAGGIAHDFNNILCSMMGYVTLVKDQLPEHSQSRKDLALAMQAGERAELLISQIFNFSRQGEQILGPLHISSFLKEALKMLRSALPATIEIRSKFSVNNRTILADPAQINQIIMNLSSNAGDAMEATGGILEVNLDEVEIEPQFSSLHDIKRGHYVKMTVKDTGCGIPQDILDQIFDPFFTTKPVGKGTGLGLSAVHGIVKNHRGTITVKSQIDVGTTFEVFFPIIDDHETSGEAPIQEAPKDAVTDLVRIMFIDDEMSLVSIGTRVLQKLGYVVEGATSSSEALEIFRSDPQQFDLVFADETMPIMTGSQLAAEMRLIRPDIPIVLMTGFDIEKVIEKTKTLGILKYLSKPIKYQQLGEIVREALGK
jgi:PAS domain S-box-containing protein